MFPPIFDPTPGFPEAKAIIAAVTTAIEAAKPPKVVCLSTIGAQATQTNLLHQLGLLERWLGAAPSPVCFLRAAWFMENLASSACKHETSALSGNNPYNQCRKGGHEPRGFRSAIKNF